MEESRTVTEDVTQDAVIPVFPDVGFAAAWRDGEPEAFEGMIVAKWRRRIDQQELVAIEDVTGVTQVFGAQMVSQLDRPLRDLRREKRNRERQIEKLKGGNDA